MTRFSDPKSLSRTDSVEDFDCGLSSLDTWLKLHSHQAATSDSARTYVVHDEKQHRVVGYHGICAASVDEASATPRAKIGMPRHSILAVLLA